MPEPASTEFILHAGAYKTATSTVQTILTRSSEYLLKQHGILYPKTGRRINSGSSNPHSTAHHPLVHCIRPRDAVLGKSRKLRQALATEIAASRARTVVISSELITFSSAAEKRELLALMADRVENVSVIYALRRPDEYCESMLNQSLKNGRMDRVTAFHQRVDGPGLKLAFLRDLQDWQSIVGPERLRVLYFSKRNYRRYLTKIFAFMGVDLADRNIDAEVHDNSAVTRLGFLLRNICYTRLDELNHVPGRVGRHKIGIHLDALEQSLGFRSEKMITIGSEMRRRVMQAHDADMAKLAPFLDAEDMAMLEEERRQPVPDGIVAHDLHALLPLPPAVLRGIVEGLCQGYLRELLRY